MQDWSLDFHLEEFSVSGCCRVIINVVTNIFAESMQLRQNKYFLKVQKNCHFLKVLLQSVFKYY